MLVTTRTPSKKLKKIVAMKGIEKSKQLDSLICLVCRKHCTSKSGLSRHLSIHQRPENSIMCEKCGKSFRNEGKYKAHDLKTHSESGVNAFGCSLCGRFFARKANLLEHTHTHGPAVCEKCGRGFKTTKCLKIHYTRVHSVDKPFKCPCGKAYTTKQSLAYHKKVHSSIRFYCPKCFDGFVTKSKLKNHMSRHSEVRPYTCAVCDKTYKTKDYTYTHLRRVHAKTKEVSKTLIIRNENSVAKSFSGFDDGYNGKVRNSGVISTSTTLFQLESSCIQHSMNLESENLGNAYMEASTHRTDSSLGDNLNSISIENSLEDDSISVADSNMSENSMFVGYSTENDCTSVADSTVDDMSEKTFVGYSTDDDSTSVADSTVDYLSQNSKFVEDSTNDDSISSSIYPVLSEDTTMTDKLELNDRSPVVEPSDISCDATSLTNNSSSASTICDDEPQLQTQENVFSLSASNEFNSMLNREEIMTKADELTYYSQLNERATKQSTLKKQIIQSDSESNEISESKDEMSSNFGIVKVKKESPDELPQRELLEDSFLYAEIKKEFDEEESGKKCTENEQYKVEPEDSFLNVKEEEESSNEKYTTKNSEYNPNAKIKEEPSEEPSDEPPEESSEETEKHVDIKMRVKKTEENGEFSKKEKHSLLKIEVKQEIPDTDMTPIALEQHTKWSEATYRKIYLGDIPSHDCDCDPLIKYGSLSKLNFRQKTAFVFCL